MKQFQDIVNAIRGSGHPSAEALVARVLVAFTSENEMDHHSWAGVDNWNGRDMVDWEEHEQYADQLKAIAAPDCETQS